MIRYIKAFIVDEKGVVASENFAQQPMREDTGINYRVKWYILLFCSSF